MSVRNYIRVSLLRFHSNKYSNNNKYCTRMDRNMKKGTFHPILPAQGQLTNKYITNTASYYCIGTSLYNNYWLIKIKEQHHHFLNK